MQNPTPAKTRTILFAGGGTGGHIFPNLAILERLHVIDRNLRPHFIVSDRPLDAQLLEQNGVAFTALSVQPLTTRPWRWPGFIKAWSDSVRRVRQIIQEQDVVAVVATGGFVSGPAVVGARKAGVPVALVNLDAVPGKANRAMARKATQVFKVYPSPQLPMGQQIGLPLRRTVIAPADKRLARQSLGLDAMRETLLLTGASQGASSMNDMMVHLVRDPAMRSLLDKWQLLHLCGGKADSDALTSAYKEAGIPAVVLPFLDTMGLAWGAATAAISRAGAGSVAEVWANAVPTIFMPYPYHRDHHQKLNAQPLVDLGGAVLMSDAKSGAENARRIAEPLTKLLTDPVGRHRMAEAMRQHAPGDGAAVVAQWLASAAAVK